MTIKEKYNNLSKQDKIHLFILIAISILAFVVRIWQFTTIPGGANQDEAMAAVDGKALADYATDRYGMFMPVHLTAWGYGQMSSLLSYLIAPFTRIFGLNLFSARLPLLLISLVSLYIIYRFVLKVGNKWIALIALFVAAISPWHIMQSRWSLDCNLFPHFLLFGSYALYLGIENKKYLYWSMVWFGLSMYCYGIAIYTVPLLLLILVVIMLIRKQVTWSSALICLGIYVLVGGPFILCMAINFFKWETIELPFMTIPFFENSVRMNDILFFSDNFFEQLKANLTSVFNIAVLQKFDGLPWNSIDGYGLFHLVSIPFVFIGLFFIIKDCKKNAGMQIMLIFTIVALFSGISTNNVNINRFNIVCYPLLFATALGIYYATVNFKYTLSIVMVVFTISFGMFTHKYFTSHADWLASCFFEGFGQSLEYAETLDCDEYYITDYSQADGYWNVSEILTLFYHEVDAEFYQDKDAFYEKYKIIDYSTHQFVPQPGIAYIVNNNELQFLDLNNFTIKSFNGFSVLLAR